MGKKSLENFCNQLFVNLTNEFLFYIPNTTIVQEEIEKSKANEFKPYLQKVMLMDWHKGPLLYVKNVLHYNEFEKSLLLEKNVLKLIDKKEQISRSSFDFVFEKYNKQVQALFYLTAWFTDKERLLQIDDTSVAMSNRFELQHRLYQKHLSSLEHVFKDKEVVDRLQSTLSIELQLTVLLDQLKTIEANQLENNKIVERIIATSRKSEIVSKVKSKYAKKILITEQEAEEFLLATVFGMKLQP